MCSHGPNVAVNDEPIAFTDVEDLLKRLRALCPAIHQLSGPS